MSAESLLAYYDRFSDVPDAIPRLRRLVLDLAVKGKLVPQDASEESASDLIARILAEQARLVKQGKVKEAKERAQTVKVAPYKVPDNWEWVPFGVVVDSHIGGGTPSKSNLSYWGGTIRWASVKDIGKGKYVDDTIDRITDAGLADSSSNLIPAGNLIVVTRMGLGKVSINRVPIAINQDLRALSLSSLIAIDYCYNFFRRHSFEGTGLTVKGIKVEELLSIPLPLPPLDEQHRIVAKVDELMALCDQLEAARAGREATRDQLTAASLRRLNAPDPVTFREDVRFALDIVAPLTSRPDQIKQLRQAVLNLAVRGRLVPQNPGDEQAPAKQSPSSSEDGMERAKMEVPFPEPQGWRWFEFGDVAIFENGDRGKNYPNRSEYVSSGIAWINTGHIQPDGSLSVASMNYITRAKFDTLGGGKIKPGDLVYCLRGATFGKTAFVEPFVEGAIASSLMIIRPGALLDRRFAYCYLMSPLGRSQLMRFDNGTAQPNLSSGNVKKYLIPIPPLAEQYRIVVKVDELMALLDQLEARITQSRSTATALMDAVVAELAAAA